MVPVSTDGDIAHQDERTPIPAVTPLTDDMLGILQNIETGIQSVVHLLAKEDALPTVDDPTTLIAGRDIRLDRKGRRFLAIYASAAVNNLPILQLGIAGTINLAAGWQYVNAPDGAIITPATGSTATPIIIRATNWYIGSAI